MLTGRMRVFFITRRIKRLYWIGLICLGIYLFRLFLSRGHLQPAPSWERAAGGEEARPFHLKEEAAKGFEKVHGKQGKDGVEILEKDAIKDHGFEKVRGKHRKDVEDLLAGEGAIKDDVPPPSFDLNKLNEAEKREYEKGYKSVGFNKYLSDRLALDRGLPDMRFAKCMIPDYTNTRLSTISVVMAVKDEPKSTLLRAITSILNRTPKSMLKNIIIVDTRTELAETHEALQKAMAMSRKVMLLRPPKVSAMNHALSFGIFGAQSDVIFVTDAHIEVNQGWAEPLVAFLNENRESVAAPTVDIIDKHTFEYRAIHEARPTFVTGFNLFLDTLPVHNTPKQEARFKSSPVPMREPAVGAHFAFRTEFSAKLGAMSLELRAGADIEISFKAWMCGMGVYRVPCSHVGHIARDPVLSPDAETLVTPEEMTKDKIRIAKFWMEEYFDIFCSRFPKKLCNETSIQDGSSVERDQCGSFKDYLTTAAFTVYIPKDIAHEGQLMTPGAKGEVCLNLEYWILEGKPTLAPCIRDPYMARNQYFMLTKKRELRQDNGCLEYDDNVTVRKIKCLAMEGMHSWKYNVDNTLYHEQSKMCLTHDAQDNLKMEACENDERSQKWFFKKLFPSAT